MNEFQKARDEANECPGPKAAALIWNAGADWAYEWCQKDRDKDYEIGTMIYNPTLDLWVKKIEEERWESIPDPTDCET